jgi:branched-subunit amino acid aminotransferase/4-amino-4-deoxychorismate lyase
MHTGSACVNGKISSLESAQIPLLDRGFLFGHGVFETVLVLDGGLVLWREHMSRLATGCQKARIPVPAVELLLQQAKRLTHDNITSSEHTAEKMQLRIIITGGNSLQLWESEQHSRAPNIIMFCRNIPGVSEAWYREGIALKSAIESRAAHTIDIKSTNYLLHMLALANAQDTGNEDAIFVTHDGEFRECTTASFLWIDSDANLATCPSEQRCLPGTTLIALKRALEKNGEVLRDAALTRATLSTARGAAILSATRGVVPVRCIDNHQFDVATLASKFSELNAMLRLEQKENGYIEHFSI